MRQGSECLLDDVAIACESIALGGAFQALRSVNDSQRLRMRFSFRSIDRSVQSNRSAISRLV